MDTLKTDLAKIIPGSEQEESENSGNSKDSEWAVKANEKK